MAFEHTDDAAAAADDASFSLFADAYSRQPAIITPHSRRDEMMMIRRLGFSPFIYFIDISYLLPT